MTAAATLTPASVSQQVYTASQQGDPTNFVLWHVTPGLSEKRDHGRVSLLHPVSHYASWMVRQPCQWDNRTFANYGDVSYGTAPLENWDPTYLHLDPAVYVPSAANINTSLDGDANLKLLGPYEVGDAGVEIICCRKKLYFPAPYAGLWLGANLNLVEAWNRLQGDISDAAAEDACRPLIDWIHVAIVRGGPNTYSALVVPKPSPPLPDALLLQHCHRLMLNHLPGLDPSISQAAGTRIAKTVREMAVEL